MIALTAIGIPQFRAPSCLDSPIEDIAEKAVITKAITPRFMRRTFQDLGRSAQVDDFVVRAISGHATTTMQEHYSSVSGDEVRSGLGRSWRSSCRVRVPMRPLRSRRAR